jgi:hypothetical protein
MTTPQDAQQFIGRTAVDSEGSKIGKIGKMTRVSDRLVRPRTNSVATRRITA